jgi:heavy metal translocating P-type ATPase
VREHAEPSDRLSLAPESRPRVHGALEVERVREDSLRIACEGVDELSKQRVLGWLAERDEVMEVTAAHAVPSTVHPEGADVVEVRFRDDPRVPGAFVRSLRDWIFTATQPKPSRLEVEMQHLLEGRVRLRLVNVSEDDVMRAAELVRGAPGVVRANASPASRSLLIAFDPSATHASALIDLLANGDPSTWPKAPPGPERNGATKAFLNTAVLAASASGLVPALPMGAAVALTAIPSMRRSLRALREKRLSVDLLDVAAIGISIYTGQPTTAAFITWLLGIGDVILEKTSDTARNAIAKVLKLDAVDAMVVHDGVPKRVKAKSLRVGDTLLIEPGGCIAADGIVVRGEALVDEKALTGESVPHAKRPGDRVLAATVLVEGELFVEIDRTGTDTTAAKIVQILEGAGAKPMTLQRETERIADRLVLPTFGVAGASAVLSGALERATSVLITDFGTGIRIAVPINALTAITIAAREGVLVKGAQYLERLSKVDTIVFDKTGTLTGGMPQIFEVVPLSGLDVGEVVRFAAAAETRQRHPVAEAIRRYAARAKLVIPEAELGSSVYSIGFGVVAQVLGREVLVGGERFLRARGIALAGATRVLERHRQAGASSVLVAMDDTIVGVIGYADEPRAESARVVAALKQGGRRRVILMSGDARQPVEATARAVGVDDSYGELLPEDKAQRVREIQHNGHVVAMVGDGINDAPALAVADVGISLDGGTDVALETADVVLLEGGLQKLPDAFRVADDAMRRVRRGLGLVIAPNAVAIGLGALGLINPAVAAMVNNGSTVLAALAGVAPLLTNRGNK